MKRPLFAFLGVTLVLLGCDSKQPRDETVHREGQPDFSRTRDGDPEMEKAIQTARKSVDSFIAALKTPSAEQAGFSVKKPFIDGGTVEHIWLSGVSFDGTRFRGRVDNEPVDVKNVKMGETVTATKDEISDWFYVEKGKLVGGYTFRVLYARLSPDEKKDFNTHINFRIE